jgi:UDP-3-O-[3-hydroxymyristoyl] glucosamine N-acyltransferase
MVARPRVIVAQVGIAGSTVLDDFVQIGGQAASRPGSQDWRPSWGDIGCTARIETSLVGSPAPPRQEFFRQVAILKWLARKRSQWAIRDHIRLLSPEIQI